MLAGCLGSSIETASYDAISAHVVRRDRVIERRAAIERFVPPTGLGIRTNRPCKRDFWVLAWPGSSADRREVKGIAGEIDVPLADADRFLTLITTDGGDADVAGGLRGTDSDWCVFVEPNLELAPPTGRTINVSTVSEL